jgi:hypothetical protein
MKKLRKNSPVIDPLITWEAKGYQLFSPVGLFYGKHTAGIILLIRNLKPGNTEFKPGATFK